ncbi:MAG: class I SAM-dependent methyltransferase [bacterium]|nr:class I SAM-dependent methyltransferase [bacterium]
MENNQYDKYFDINKFDLIYMEHVFEHILYPVSVLQYIRKYLKNDGLLFICLYQYLTTTPFSQKF